MFLNRRKRLAPRLAVELDDIELGAVCRRLTARSATHTRALAVPLAQQLLGDTGADWDRRAHRLSVLAQVTRPGTQLSWVQQHPDDADALTLFAWGFMARGSAAPPSPSDAHVALRACGAAARLSPADPNPWVVRLGLLRLLRRPGPEVLATWREIAVRDPWHREAHLQMYGYLSPRECGSTSHCMDFVDQVTATAPVAAPASGLPLLSLVDRYHATLARGGIEALTAGYQWGGHEAVRCLARAEARWLRSGHLTHAAALADLNLLAYALSAAREPARAAPVFQALAGVVTLFPWSHGGQDPLDTYCAAQHRAYTTGR